MTPTITITNTTGITLHKHINLTPTSERITNLTRTDTIASTHNLTSQMPGDSIAFVYNLFLSIFHGHQ